MPASDYVFTYLHLWCRIQEKDKPVQYGTFAVRNYLQAGRGDQSTRAEQAKGDLLSKVPKIPGYKKASAGNFEVNGEKFLALSINRVFTGKGAPSEIQDVVWLASLAGIVTLATLPAYADAKLGVDCGGFVANYWGLGLPTESSPSPEGRDGFLPRTIWGRNAANRRTAAGEIQAGDAIIFFSGVSNNDPTQAATKKDGAWVAGSGSKAEHIGLVNAIYPAGNNKYWLEIAESSEGAATSGGNGVNVRFAGNALETQLAVDLAGPPSPQTPIELKVANKLVYYESGGKRLYFVGRNENNASFPQEHQT